MQPRYHIVPNTIQLASLLVLATVCSVAAADKPSATLLIKDSLTSPKNSVTVEAKLTAKGLLTNAALGGEPLELLVKGKVVATAMTGGDGKAYLSYRPETRGVIPAQIRVGKSPRVAPTEAQGHLAVWERRKPILMVEMSALFENPAAQKPMADAAEELGKLTRFYYNVIYVVNEERGKGDAFQASDEARQWLSTHKFPLGYVLVLPPSDGALGSKLDELRDAGWSTIRIGVGRTKKFAEAFVQRRLDAVMVPEPAKSEKARKAKVAKEWKDVRKHF
jgi:hypothetical protein